ncbi:hypothetical protein RHCRD62_50221 [Rhodococcus sp. RD6.2]|nr:hypothetical protein RHCRD62_50221 [Rhodococcus sp. RD6.2]
MAATPTTITRAVRNGWSEPELVFRECVR